MKVIATEKAPAAIGPYSQAIEVNGMVYTSGVIPVNPSTGQAYVNNGVLYTSGQLGINPETGNLGGDTIEEQAEWSCKNVGEILKAAGTDYEHVLKTTCFLADIADFGAFNEVYAKYFTSKPARSCFAVKDLPKGALCEIEVIAAVEE